MLVFVERKHKILGKKPLWRGKEPIYTNSIHATPVGGENFYHRAAIPASLPLHAKFLFSCQIRTFWLHCGTRTFLGSGFSVTGLYFGTLTCTSWSNIAKLHD